MMNNMFEELDKEHEKQKEYVAKSTKSYVN